MLIFLVLASGMSAAEEGLPLASGGRALQPVVISPRASPELRRVAAELAEFLGKIGGASFEVVEGDGSQGIVLGTLKQFPSPALAGSLALRGSFDGREAYALRTEPGRLLLLGATDLGASHAAFRFLEILGCRWFFPAPEWTVLPSRPDLRASISESGRPALLARRIWYGWGFFDRQAAEEYRAWARRNRMASSVRLQAGHSWEALIARHRKVFEEHPEYLALVKNEKDGTERRQGEKLCLSNPAVRRLVVEDALARLEKDPAADTVSVEPSDGGGHCQCGPCTAMGGVSDRVFGMANEVARAVAAKHPGKGVGLLAYHLHTEPPSFGLEPNVYVQLTTAFTTGRYTFDELAEMWPRKCWNIGYYDYFSVYAWDRDTFPGGGAADLDALRGKIRRFAALGAVSFDAESGNNWGLHGRSYYTANRLLWDPGADVEAILEDFYRNAFGPAAAPMRRYYDRFDRGRKPLLSEHLLALGFRDVEEASRLAAGRPDVLARLGHLKVFLRSVHLRWKYDRTRDREERKRLALELLTHLYRSRRSYMNHWEAARQDWTPKLAREFGEPSWDAHAKGGPPWAVDRPYAAEEVERVFREGLEAFRPDPVEEKGFSEDLVPVEFPGGLSGPPSRQTYQGGVRYWLYSLRGEPLDARVVPGTIAWYRNRADARWTFRDPGGKVLSEGRLPLDGNPHDLRIEVLAPGLYTLEVQDNGAGWSLTLEAGRPAAIPLRRDKGYSHLGHMPPMFFYVPRGTREIQYFWSGGPHRVHGPDGAPVRRVETSGVFVKVPVPEGADGKVWKFTELALGHLWFFNTPNFLSPSPGTLLIPREVAVRDGLKTGP